MEKGGRIIVLIIGVIIISGMLWTALRLERDNSKKQQEQTREQVRGSRELSVYPEVKNIPPSIVEVGSVYSYTPRVMVKGSARNIKLEIIEGPRWLYLNDSNVFGLPATEDRGANKVVLRVWNGDVYIDYTFYIQVNEKASKDTN